MVQTFLKKWWVESDFKAPNLPLSLRLKVSAVTITVFITILEQNRSNSCHNSTKLSEVNVKNFLRHTLIKKYLWHFCFEHLSLYIFTIWKSIVYYRLCRDGIYFDKILVSVYKLFKRSNKANLFIALVQ